MFFSESVREKNQSFADLLTCVVKKNSEFFQIILLKISVNQFLSKNMPQYFTVTYIFHNIFFIVFHNGKEWGFINAIHNDKGGALIFDFSLADRKGAIHTFCNGKGVTLIPYFSLGELFKGNCNSFNLVYCFKCKICDILYVGNTVDSLKNRVNDHM